MKVLFILTFLIASLFSGEFKLKKWQDGETFGGYLTRHHIDSTKFYNQINPDDIKFLSSIQSGAPFFEDENNGTLNQTLIPLGEEMQISVFKKGGEYKFDIIPINYKTIKDRVHIKIENSCFSDIKKATNNPNLATYLKKIFKGYVDFTKLRKGDVISIEYKQKSIDGIPWGEPNIKAAYVKHRDNEYFAVSKGDNYQIWTNKSIVKSVTKFKIIKSSASYKSFFYPLDKIRITSPFSYKRWHPILHRYRPHLGIDFGAKWGTPIHAIASGKVIYAGWMRGYGRVTKIAHGAGLVSLYAHQSKQLVHVGQMVKARQVIGRIGSTGRSTGPHLHLGVYKYGKPINPKRVLHKIVKIKGGSSRSVKIVKNVKSSIKNLPYREKKLYNTLSKLHNATPYIWKNLDEKINISVKEKKDASRIKLSSSKGAT